MLKLATSLLDTNSLANISADISSLRGDETLQSEVTYRVALRFISMLAQLSEYRLTEGQWKKEQVDLMQSTDVPMETIRLKSLEYDVDPMPIEKLYEVVFGSSYKRHWDNMLADFYKMAKTISVTVPDDDVWDTMDDAQRAEVEAKIEALLTEMQSSFNNSIQFFGAFIEQFIPPEDTKAESRAAKFQEASDTFTAVDSDPKEARDITTERLIKQIEKEQKKGPEKPVSGKTWAQKRNKFFERVAKQFFSAPPIDNVHRRVSIDIGTETAETVQQYLVAAGQVPQVYNVYGDECSFIVEEFAFNPPGQFTLLLKMR